MLIIMFTKMPLYLINMTNMLFDVYQAKLASNLSASMTVCMHATDHAGHSRREGSRIPASSGQIFGEIVQSEIGMVACCFRVGLDIST